MFQKPSKADSSVASINLIGAGTSIIGDITSNGDIRIDGSLNGNLSITGKLVVGSTGKIIGNVTCQHADISGEINGRVTVENTLILKATSKITGDLIAMKLAIEPNAIFSGTCNMPSEKATTL